MNTYHVTVLDTARGPDAAMRERLARCAVYRLQTLEKRRGHYPSAGGTFDMLDHFEGPFFWERSDEEMVDNPPCRVDYEVVAVDPPTAPEGGGEVRVTVRVAG